MKKKQSEQLGKILAQWNAEKLEAGDALYQITKLFPRIFHRAWKEYVEKEVKHDE
jgi:hypothetical protein